MAAADRSGIGPERGRTIRASEFKSACDALVDGGKMGPIGLRGHMGIILGPICPICPLSPILGWACQDCPNLSPYRHDFDHAGRETTHVPCRLDLSWND